MLLIQGHPAGSNLCSSFILPVCLRSYCMKSFPRTVTSTSVLSRPDTEWKLTVKMQTPTGWCCMPRPRADCSSLEGQKWGVNVTGNSILQSPSHSAYPESFPRLPSQGNLCPPRSSHLPSVFSKWQVFPSSGR